MEQEGIYDPSIIRFNVALDLCSYSQNHNIMGQIC